MSRLDNSIVSKIGKLTTKELENLLYDIDTWEITNGKLQDIRDAIDVVNDSRHPYTIFADSVLKDFQNIQSIVEEIMDKIDIHFRDLDITEGNIDYIHELLESQLKHKLCRKLKIRMKDNKEIYNNLDQYTEDYFLNYDIGRKVDDRLEHMENWISGLYEMQNDIKDGNVPYV